MYKHIARFVQNTFFLFFYQLVLSSPPRLVGNKFLFPCQFSNILLHEKCSCNSEIQSKNKNCVERLRTLHPDNFSSFRILSSQRILSGHLILIPSALRNYSIMGHYSPGTISFLQILRQDCPTIGKSKSVFKYCSETFKDNSANCWYFVAQGDLRRFYQVLLH